MTINELASLIPIEYQDEILRTNMIANAVASTMDSSMMYLATIWKNYVNPDEDLTCSICIQRIFGNYKALQPVFIEMAKKRNLLNSL